MDTPTESTETSQPEVEAPKEDTPQEKTDATESTTEDQTTEAQEVKNPQTEEEPKKSDEENVTEEKNQEETAENEDDDDERAKRKKDKKRKKEKKDKKSKKEKKHKKRKHREEAAQEEEDNAGEEGKDNESDDVDFKLDDVDEDKPKKRLRKAKEDDENNQEGVLDVDDEDPEYESKKEKKKKKKKKDRERKKRHATEEGNENNENIIMHDAEDEEGAPRQSEEPREEVDEIDQLLNQIKQGRGTRRKKIDKEELAMKELSKITEFVAKMDMVAEDDRKANQLGQPALGKVKMLGELNEQLQKKHLQSLFIENNILGAMSKWLEPLPDGSLPNMKVRESVLTLLYQIGAIDKEDLRESGIGKAVMLLYKHPKETADNKKLSKQLIERWSRPIFNLNDRYQEYYRELNEQEQSLNPQERRKTSTLNRSSSQEAADLDSALDKKRTSTTPKDSVTFHAHIPEKMAMDFKIRPKSEDLSKAKKKGMTEKQKKIALSHTPKGKSRIVPRALGVSIEGRGFVPHV